MGHTRDRQPRGSCDPNDMAGGARTRTCGWKFPAARQPSPRLGSGRGAPGGERAAVAGAGLALTTQADTRTPQRTELSVVTAEQEPEACTGEKPTRKGCVPSVPVLGWKSLPCSLSQRVLCPLRAQHCSLQLPRTRGEETVPTLAKSARQPRELNDHPAQEHRGAECIGVVRPVRRCRRPAPGAQTEASPPHCVCSPTKAA
ncbi:uncharacterized protein LOC123948524 isoform X2 [Meles meles]|uniref:uncharacterized protein LOC123948524 isoform X2 n=1 Tax=Meles meles TaxID=9662 RepID=UPI001E69FAFC|nr:uncharacterized protein LOC123948524 isoform X2 [Meles meles]